MGCTHSRLVPEPMFLSTVSAKCLAQSKHSIIEGVLSACLFKGGCEAVHQEKVKPSLHHRLPPTPSHHWSSSSTECGAESNPTDPLGPAVPILTLQDPHSRSALLA